MVTHVWNIANRVCVKCHIAQAAYHMTNRECIPIPTLPDTEMYLFGMVG